MTVPKNIAAKVLFLSDRTCCVCHTKGKPIQIHHIDGDDTHNDIKNLAVLCLDCHNETQIRGGFHRKLDSEQIILYRDDWYVTVSRERARSTSIAIKEISDTRTSTEFVTSLAEIYRERGQYELLAIYYEIWGNTELRDKYIEKCLEKPVSDQTLVFLRSLQGRIDLVLPDVITREIARRASNEDWSQLARLYVALGKWEEAAKYYCKSILNDIDEKNVFAAAYYLKELFREGIYPRLFEKAFRKASDKKDLWWQVRALQELGWRKELKELLVNNKKEIEESGDIRLLELLYEALGNKSKMLEIKKLIAKKTSISIVDKIKSHAKAKKG